MPWIKPEQPVGPGLQPQIAVAAHLQGARLHIEFGELWLQLSAVEIDVAGAAIIAADPEALRHARADRQSHREMGSVEAFGNCGFHRVDAIAGSRQQSLRSRSRRVRQQCPGFRFDPGHRPKPAVGELIEPERGAHIQGVVETQHGQRRPGQPLAFVPDIDCGATLQPGNAIVQRQPHTLFGIDVEMTNGGIGQSLLGVQNFELSARFIEQQQPPAQRGQANPAIRNPPCMVEVTQCQLSTRRFPVRAQRSVFGTVAQQATRAKTDHQVAVGESLHRIDRMRQRLQAGKRFEALATQAHQLAAFKVTVDFFVRPKAPGNGCRAAQNSRFPGIQFEQDGIGGEQPAVADDNHLPYVVKRGDFTGEAVQQRPVEDVAVFILFQNAEILLGADQYRSVRSGGQRTNRATAVNRHTTPTSAVEHQHHALVAEVHVAAPVLRHRPVLRARAIV